MKKISALITTLVLGVSSAAMAAPSDFQPGFGPANRRPIEQPVVRPFRPQLPVAWTTLESNGSLRRGRDMIDVRARAKYTKLKLEASRGSLFIDKVVIVFGNGQRQVVNLDKVIGTRGGAAFIDLDGRGRHIDKIMVSGKGGWRSGYTLSAL